VGPGGPSNTVLDMGPGSTRKWNN